MEMNSVNEVSQTLLVEMLISSFDKKFLKLSADSYSADTSYSYAASIYKVSETLRKENEKAYTPKLVSIGPLHHDRVELQGMESFKLRFTHKFLTRFGIRLHTVVKFAVKEESFVRGCYEGTLGLSSKQLTEVILLDGIFILQLFLENYFFQLRDKYERIFDEKGWMYNDLLHDMLLLENQLPIRIMESLLNFVDLSFLNEGTMVTIYDLAQKFFKNIGNTHKVPLTPHFSEARHFSKARHFVEFLLFLHIPEKPPVPSRDTELRNQLSARKFEFTRSAGELVRAGVKLRSGKRDCLFDVQFDVKEGVLTIPKLTVDESTETFFRNLIAFEHLGYYGYFSRNITSYVMLMDRFINTSSDVDLLVKHGIIENKLSRIKHDDIINNKLSRRQRVADLFNNLYKGVLTEVNDFYFAELCEKLHDYNRSSCHRWRARWFRGEMVLRDKWVKWIAMLKRDYFNNPWSILSVIAAILLLTLTIIQTVCSIIQVV